MVLKIKHGDTWRYIDKLYEVDITPNKEGNEPHSFAAYNDSSGEHVTIGIYDEAYLLNNQGRTIERLNKPRIV